MAKDAKEAAERLRRQQETLAEFGLYALRADDLDELLTRACESVARGCGVKRAKVLELLPGGKEMLVRAGVNWKPGVVGHVRLGAGLDSPAGYALHHDEPVVSPDTDKEKRFAIPQVLIDHRIKSMVNVIILGKDAPFGVLEVDATRKIEFDAHDISFVQNYANLLAAAIERHRSHKDLEEAARSQMLLVQELEHRVKNLLGLVQALASQTSAEEPGARTYRDKFLGRLQALAQAESLVFEDHARVIELEQLVNRSIEPFEAAGAERLSINGCALRLPARVGRILALVLHELGTNATKYGALSGVDGNVTVSWQVDEDAESRQLRFRWQEQGGPPVGPPERQGFGSKLLTRLAPYEIDGEAELNHCEGGLVYGVVFPLD